MVKMINYQGSMDALVWHKERKNLTSDCEVLVPMAHEAVFVRDGQMTDSFTTGRYLLSESAVGEGHLFSHPGEKVDCQVYYVKKEGSYNIKWHLPSPLTLTDPNLKITASLNLAGAFGLKIIDSKQFLKRLLTFMKKVTLEEVKAFFAQRMAMYIKEQLLAVMAENKITVLDLNKMIMNVSKLLELKMRYSFESFGVSVEAFMLKKVEIIGSASAEIEVAPAEAEKPIKEKAAQEDTQPKGEAMYCAECGEALPPLSNFCHKCGVKVN